MLRDIINRIAGRRKSTDKSLSVSKASIDTLPIKYIDEVGDYVAKQLEEYPQIAVFGLPCDFYSPVGIKQEIPLLMTEYNKLRIFDKESPLNELAGNPSIGTLIKGALNEYNPKEMLFQKLNRNRILMHYKQHKRIFS